MRKKIFIDTNILLSGIFFEGNEDKLLSLIDIDLYVSDLIIEEAKQVIQRKFEAFGLESCRVGIEELNQAVLDIIVVTEKEYSSNLKVAKELLNKEKDSKILAAVMTVKPDYFISGDQDFDKPEIKKVVNLARTREVLNKLGVL